MTTVEREEQVEQLVGRYAKAAMAHGRATEAGDHKKANRAYDELAAIYRELRRRGPDAQRALLPLLNDPEPGVCAWAASHALEFAPVEGEPVLRALESIPKSLVSFSAKMTLQQWREGKLQFP